MSNLPPLLKAQFDEGLRVKRPKPTQDFYKHIYINSDQRANQGDPSSNCTIFLQQPIETPPDGTTFIRLQRASIPYTFHNIVYDVGLKVSTIAVADGAETNVRRILIKKGWYSMRDLLTHVTECLSNTGYYATGGPNSGLATVFTATRVNQYFSISYTGGVAGQYVRVQFLDYAAFNAIAPAGNYAVQEANTINLATLAKRTFGFDFWPTAVYPDANPGVQTNTLLSYNIFGPFQEYEVFLRISGMPVNYDLVDGGTGAPSDILAVVPLNVDTFGSVMSLKAEDSLSYVLPPSSKIHRITLKLTYRDGQKLVDLQGQDFSCILSIIKENSVGV